MTVSEGAGQRRSKGLEGHTCHSGMTSAPPTERLRRRAPTSKSVRQIHDLAYNPTNRLAHQLCLFGHPPNLSAYPPKQPEHSLGRPARQPHDIRNRSHRARLRTSHTSLTVRRIRLHIHRNRLFSRHTGLRARRTSLTILRINPSIRRVSLCAGRMI